MNVVLAICHKEIDRAIELLEWTKELDKKSPSKGGHRLIVLGSSKTKQEELQRVASIASSSFFGVAGSVRIIKQQQEEERPWPTAPNALFRVAVQWSKEQGKGPWLWWETDAIPLFPSWLDKIEEEYFKAGKPFMGAAYDKPWLHINGVMIYPQNVWRYNPQMGFGPKPFDLTNSDRVLSLGHASTLIQRSLKDPTKNEPWSFKTMEEVGKVIKPNTVLFHGCKDGSLIKVLREQSTTNNGKWHVEQNTNLIKRATAAFRRVVNNGDTFYHSGNLGDIAYALYAIMLRGGGSLIVGPVQNNTAPCSNPVSKAQFELLEPLLKSQPYIKSASWSPLHPGDSAVDLNKFRNQWQDASIRARTEINTLCKMHCFNVAVDHLFKENQPWLTMKQPIWTGKIIVARSPRHQANDFPWGKLVEKFSKRMLFIGLQSEHMAFQKEFKTRVSYYDCSDFLEMARVIAGGECFVGNQSFPMAMAVGLGQRIFCETYPKAVDCFFNRPTFLDQRNNTVEDFEKMLNGKTGVGKESRDQNRIVVRRSKAIGDVLAATYIAKELIDKGYEVEWQAIKEIHPLLKRVQLGAPIKISTPEDGDCDVNLDGAYEDHPERTSKHFAQIFLESANEQLSERGIRLGKDGKAINFGPRLKSDERLRLQLRKGLEKWPRPWVMICPRSWHWPNRTVRKETWEAAADKIEGTCFELVNEQPKRNARVLKSKPVPLSCPNLDVLIEHIANADLVLSVDSGPAHIAIALGVPTIVIGQSSDPTLHFSDQRDWSSIYPQEKPVELLTPETKEPEQSTWYPSNI